MTTEVSIWLTGASVEVSQLAGKLGGICTEERPNPTGIEQIYQFSMETFASQFQFSVLHFTKAISVGRSPDLSKVAIAESRLCDCGWTTKQQCDRKCESPVSDNYHAERSENNDINNLKWVSR